MKQIIKLNESQLHRVIKESIYRILNENIPHYWERETTCPRCGRKEGSSMHGGLCRDCYKEKMKNQSNKKEY